MIIPFPRLDIALKLNILETTKLHLYLKFNGDHEEKSSAIFVRAWNRMHSIIVLHLSMESPGIRIDSDSASVTGQSDRDQLVIKDPVLFGYGAHSRLSW